MTASFSINLYDNEGDAFEECILLYCNENTILKFKNISELNDFANSIKNDLIPEIKEAYENEEL